MSPAGLLLRVLPHGFVRTRPFGLRATRGRPAKLARCRALLAAPPPPASEPVVGPMPRLAGVDMARCPVCQRECWRVVGLFRPGDSPWRA